MAPPIADKDLPSLDQALNARHVAQRCATQWPWLGEVLHCVRRDTKYVPTTRCLVAYELLARLPGSSPRSHFAVVEVTRAGLRHRLAADDPGLPGLAALCDSDAVGARCAELFAPVEQCEVSIVRYKPGTRCVLRLVCTGSAGGRLFAKAFHHGAHEQAETLAGLHALDDPGLPGFAEPVALWSDWAAIVQREVEGTPLHSLLDGPDRAPAFHACGRHLAGLHAATIDGPHRRPTEDAAELATYTSAIAQADAALADRFAALIARLDSVVTELVPSHGALRTDAFILPAADPRPVLIDLDGFCHADPARDLGNLLAYLDWRAIRHPRDRDLLRLLADAFLHGYDHVRALPHPERLRRYEAESLLKIAGRRYRSLAFTEWPLVPQLIQLATDLLGR